MLYEEEDVRQYYIPWSAFDELQDEKNYHYGNVETWPRMRSRVFDKFFGRLEVPETSLGGLRRAIEVSRFGDLISFLAKEKVLNPSPKLSSLLHSVPKSHFIRFYAPEKLQSSRYTPLYGAGASYTSLTEALSKALGEFLERYVLLAPFFDKKRNRIIRSSFSDRDIPRALLYQIPRFFEWQLKHIPKGLTRSVLEKKDTKHATIHCVSGESLNQRKKAYIPLQHIQWGPHYNEGKPFADSFFISPRTTNGGGGGFSLADATLSGLCELVERDGFMIFWLNNLSPRQIRIGENDHAKFSSRFLEVYLALFDRGYKIYFLDTTTDVHIPSVACLILSPLPDGNMSVTVTGKCHPDPYRTLESALLEHTAFLSYSAQKKTSELSSQYKPFSDRRFGKDERIDLWRSGKITDRINFFISGPQILMREWAANFEPISTNDKEELLLGALAQFSRLEKIEGKAYEVFRYQVRHRILDEAEYYVTKVIVPALMPLYLSENSAPLDCERLRLVPQKLGYTAAPSHAYNPLPHPFP